MHTHIQSIHVAAFINACIQVATCIKHYTSCTTFICSFEHYFFVFFVIYDRNPQRVHFIRNATGYKNLCPTSYYVQRYVLPFLQRAFKNVHLISRHTKLHWDINVEND